MTKCPMMDAAREFLSMRRIAVVGVSRAEEDFSRTLLRAFLSRGYDAVPVNPALPSVEGRRCHARVQDIHPPVPGALLLTSPAQTDAIVRDCVEAGVQMIWMHRGGGPGSSTPAAIECCRNNQIKVVTDLCPFMAFPNATWPHRLHGFFRRHSISRRDRPTPSARAK